MLTSNSETNKTIFFYQIKQIQYKQISELFVPNRLI